MFIYNKFHIFLKYVQKSDNAVLYMYMNSLRNQSLELGVLFTTVHHSVIKYIDSYSL